MTICSSYFPLVTGVELNIRQGLNDSRITIKTVDHEIMELKKQFDKCPFIKKNTNKLVTL